MFQGRASRVCISRQGEQEVAFIFAEVSKKEDFLEFQFRSWHGVKPDEFRYQSFGYVELRDEMRAKIMKLAFDLEAAIVELHSHPYSRAACFSPSDFEGFDEFVPHVRWRLGGRPYAAVVYSRIDFDAIVWIDDPQHPQQLTELVAGKRHLYPNGLTLRLHEHDSEF